MAIIDPQTLKNESEQGWKIKHGGERKGAYLTIENGEQTAQATVLGWLDSTRTVTTKCKARYLVAQKWGGSPQASRHFVLDIA